MNIERILPQNVDSTMLTCARSCMKKFEWEFVLGLRPANISIDLHAGSCFAIALETVYDEVWRNDLPLHEAIVKAHGVYAVNWGDFIAPPKHAKNFDRVWEAVEDYFRVYPPRVDHIQPYFRRKDGSPTSEFTFAIPLDDPEFPRHPSGDPFLYSGRFDMLGTYMDQPVFKDDKTTGKSIGDRWTEQWDLRAQFMGYQWALNRLGIPCEQGVVRGIAIQKTQIVHAEAIKPYPKELIARWYEQLKRDLWKISRAWDEGYFDYNFGDSCTSYGRCFAADLCLSAVPENWMQNFVVRRWNPLLKNPIGETKSSLAA